MNKIQGYLLFLVIRNVEEKEDSGKKREG